MREKITKNRKYILIVLGVLILSTLYVGMKYLMRPKYEPLPVVKLNDKETNKKKFAIMVQNGESYEEYTNEDGTWPSEDDYEFKEAKCIDNEGNLVNNAVTFESGRITLKTNKTIYCTLYFDEQKGPLEITNVEVSKNGSDTTGGIVTLIVSAQGGEGKYTYSVENSCSNGTGSDCSSYAPISIVYDDNIITIKYLKYCYTHNFKIKVTDEKGDMACYAVVGIKLYFADEPCLYFWDNTVGNVSIPVDSYAIDPETGEYLEIEVTQPSLAVGETISLYAEDAMKAAETVGAVPGAVYNVELFDISMRDGYELDHPVMVTFGRDSSSEKISFVMIMAEDKHWYSAKYQVNDDGTLSVIFEHFGTVAFITGDPRPSVSGPFVCY